MINYGIRGADGALGLTSIHWEYQYFCLMIFIMFFYCIISILYLFFLSLFNVSNLYLLYGVFNVLAVE